MSVNWEDYLENLQQQLDLEAKKFLRNIKMTRDCARRDLFIMELPDLSFRQSGVRNGSMLVYPTGQKKVKYLGYIYKVQGDCVTLRFGKKILGFNENMGFDVAFTVYNWTLTCQGRAVRMADNRQLEEVLFPAAPTISGGCSRITLPQLRLFNKQLENDKEQYQAVQHIVAGTSTPAPYILCGPPGTGTTVTLVEAIQQIEERVKTSHILVCASRNDVADLLCQLIVKKVDMDKVFRMYPSSMDPNRVLEDLKECSNLKGGFNCPSKHELQKYKIIVSTLVTTARLVSKILKGHFTHIFIDKAEVASETECLIPLAGLLDPKSGQVVLAGDPKQLGPIVSTLALRKGREVSLLERLMNDFGQYKKNDSRYVTKLLHNYRSHPAILEVPGELIYNGELQACTDESLASTQVRNSCCNWEHLPTKGFPVIFHAVVGVQGCEDNSFSSYNEAEVKKLMDYVKKLLQTKSNRIPPSDIGIITPYRKQVQKIHEALKNIGKDLKIANMNCLKVGTVEKFQGQERRVILVSTICSSQYQTRPNKEITSHFVKNNKRFNVAVTRAKALLIVVGDPTVWKNGDTWHKFIQFCKERGGYKDEKE